jgi:hypothetical protein
MIQVHQAKSTVHITRRGSCYRLYNRMPQTYVVTDSVPPSSVLALWLRGLGGSSWESYLLANFVDSTTGGGELRGRLSQQPETDLERNFRVGCPGSLPRLADFWGVTKVDAGLLLSTMDVSAVADRPSEVARSGSGAG